MWTIYRLLMTGGVRRATLTVRVVSAMLLAASTLVWMPAGAWTSDDGNDTQPDDTETTETP